MFRIKKNNKMEITRGDTGYLTITVNGYEMVSGDTLTLTVKNTDMEEEICFQKVTDSEQLKIEPADTKSMEYGEYVYDVELKTKEGDIFTIIEEAPFTVRGEVTW